MFKWIKDVVQFLKEKIMTPNLTSAELARQDIVPINTNLTPAQQARQNIIPINPPQSPLSPEEGERAPFPPPEIGIKAGKRYSWGEKVANSVSSYRADPNEIAVRVKHKPDAGMVCR